MDTRPKEHFIVGVALGTSIAALAAVTLMTLGLYPTFGQWLEKWQTLLTGFMALAGAIGTVWWIQRQIDQARSQQTEQRAQEEERRERHQFAARATLPAALAELIDYVDAAIEALEAVPVAGSNAEIPLEVKKGGQRNYPIVPAEAVSVLRTCIETADRQPREQMRLLLARVSHTG